MKPYPEAIALVEKLLQGGKERGQTMVGAITLLTAEEREILFKIVATPGTSFSVDDLAVAATRFIILSPQDQAD